MNKTGIEWCDETWNPVSGCSKVSQGCKHCYAERVFQRAYSHDRVIMGCVGPGGEPATRPRNFTDVRCHEDRLDQPLRMRKPRRIFVNSMSDLFHEDVPDEFIAEVWTTMSMAAKHTFLVLTKRPARMLAWITRCANGGGLGWITHDGTEPARAYNGTGIVVGKTDNWPLRNVWLGVSVEDQATADERIPLLLQTPAAVRFVSYEPALGPVNLRRIESPHHAIPIDALNGIDSRGDGWLTGAIQPAPTLDWVIVGGESGPGARPFDVQWARDIVAQCKAASVPVFVKQLGARPVDGAMFDIVCNGKVHYSRPQSDPLIAEAHACPGYSVRSHDMRRLLRDRKGGDPSEWPEDLRVREWPA